MWDSKLGFHEHEFRVASFLQPAGHVDKNNCTQEERNSQHILENITGNYVNRLHAVPLTDWSTTIIIVLFLFIGLEWNWVRYYWGNILAYSTNPW
jgi:hypothetical protein